MTPNFALSLSFEGIALLRRMGTRWAHIEEVPLDHADLDSAVIALRDRAEALDPSGAQVALIIPNEQIRYLDQPDLGGDEATREVAIRAALDGATPYAVRELKFDHVVSGGRLMIAAVAHMTLEEARVFALEHGFQPVCFLAQAPEGTFDGAVFFGKARNWTRAVSRPARPIEIVPADKAALTPLPAPEPDPTPAPRPVRTPEAATAPTPAPAAPAPGAAAASQRPPEPSARPESQAAAPLPGAARSMPPSPPGKPAPAVTQPAKRPESATPPLAAATKPVQVPPGPARPSAHGKPASPPEPEAKAAPSFAFSTIRASRGVAPSAPDVAPPAAATAQFKPRFTPIPTPDAGAGAEAADTARPAAKAPSPDTTATGPTVADATPAAPAQQPKSGFFAKSTATSLLEQAAAAADEAERVPPAEQQPKPRRLALPKRKAAPPKAPGRPAGEPLPGKASAPGAAPPLAARGKAPAPARDAEAAPVPSAAVARRAPPAPQASSAKPNPLARLAALRSAGAPALAGGLATEGGPSMVGAASPGRPVFNSPDERARMTVFGERDRDAVGGKPRFLGLILTAILLLFLAGVAAWASVFLEDGLARLFRGGDRSEPAVAALPDAAGDGVILESAAPEAPTAPPTPEAGGTEDAPDARLAALDTGVSTADGPLAVPVVPRALTVEEAAETYAASGVWQRAPASPLTPPEDGVDNIYVASIDPVIQMYDAVALPDVRQLERDPGVADPGLPPPAGLTFDFDERDLIRATPQGALTPDGLRIFTGRPPVIPPLRNSGDDSRGPVTDMTPVPEVARLETIPRIRPEARPSDVIEQRERVQLSGISRAELARIRPQPRPQTAQEQAEIDTPEGTELAVARSLVPVGRPRDMATIVDQAEVRPDPAPVQTTAVAPRTVEPTLPSSASVARSATIDNAISLNKINLIGVYGTSESRRALVRLASGKYQKVKVGDSLDGGKVSAIGEDELRYQKGGRDLVLTMPRG